MVMGSMVVRGLSSASGVGVVMGGGGLGGLSSVGLVVVTLYVAVFRIWGAHASPLCGLVFLVLINSFRRWSCWPFVSKKNQKIKIETHLTYRINNNHGYRISKFVHCYKGHFAWGPKSQLFSFEKPLKTRLIH